ncbi:MAG TPA: glycosyltransferase, partial [bacterium]|nr:glycosyltransferase [bacterium]
ERDKRVRVMHQANRGEAGARNTGISASSGQFVGFVDSDDYISQGYYENMLAPFRKYSGIDMVISGISVVSFGRTKRVSCGKDILLDRNRFAAKFFQLQEKGCLNTVWNKLYPAQLTKKVLFKSDRKIGPDYVFNLECFTLCKKFAIIPEHGYFYVMRSNSVTGRAVNSYQPEHELEKSLEWRRLTEFFFKKLAIPAVDIEKHLSMRQPLWFYILAKNVISPGTPYSFRQQAVQLGKIMNHVERGKGIPIKKGRGKIYCLFLLCRILRAPLSVLIFLKTFIFAERCCRGSVRLLRRPTPRPEGDTCR